ncbi:MAG: hypothetical protein K2K55_09200, partial [Duncaniella sp.]|nr:hypothetical protein [Duncaniella sp.]
MKARRFFIILSSVLLGAVSAVAQSYFDDDIYYNPEKDAKAKAEKAAKQAAKEAEKRAKAEAALVGRYESADAYADQLSGTRSISVDEYNRRGIFAVDSVLMADSVQSDFAYTRRIEKFYNPEIVDLVNADEQTSAIYYMEPQTVNVYVNTPSSFWGYDYFDSPFFSWNYGWASPSWRWNSPWYWNSWYDPYWSWNWGWGWSGPSWG